MDNCEQPLIFGLLTPNSSFWGENRSALVMCNKLHVQGHLTLACEWLLLIYY